MILEKNNFYFFTDKIWTGSDFFIYSNTVFNNYEYLVFFDSRGFSGSFEDSIIGMLKNYFEKNNFSYLIINRPVEITTWATLCNFITYNNIEFKFLITNMGFVDFTPKKSEVISTNLYQLYHLLPNHNVEIQHIENYNSGNDYIKLYIIDYPSDYKKIIKQILREKNVILINTPIVQNDISIKRRRPYTFFDCILKSNNFNDNLGFNITLQPPNFNELYTYDAVHYTKLGNLVIYQLISKYL